MPVSWGLVGAGRVAGTWTCPAIARHEGSVLRAVASASDGGRALAAKYDAEVVGSLEALLDREDVDAVYVATPNALHADQVVACAEHGKSVLCEKPLALGAADARRAVDAAERAGVTLGVAFQYRYHPALAAVREVIASGELGRPLLVQAEIGGLYPFRTWRNDHELAGFGAVTNMGVHVYDAIEHVTGFRIASVSAMTNAAGRELETVALSLFELDDGVLAYVNANQSVPQSTPDLTVDCTEGRIVVSTCFRLGVESELLVLGGNGAERARSYRNEAMFDRLVTGFAEAIAEGGEAPIPGSAGLRSAEIVDGLARSAREGARVRIGVEVAA
jgi:1,5-anhydro-D-fructose reductase (1,5-anhydro-D-mannitol-forming)